MKRRFCCSTLQHVYFKCPLGTHCLEQTAPSNSLEARGTNRKTAQECKCVLEKKTKEQNTSNGGCYCSFHDMEKPTVGKKTLETHS